MNLFTVRKHTLLLIASIVWLAAGINIARIGFEAYANNHVTPINVLLSAAVGAVFWLFVFGKLVSSTRHALPRTKRSATSSSSSSTSRHSSSWRS